MLILGISAYYHDSASCLISDGVIIAAAQEERFTRKKHDLNFPNKAIEYCLHEAKKSFADLDFVVFYDKPMVKFERLLETYLTFAPRGYLSFIKAMPLWIKDKIFLKKILLKEMDQYLVNAKKKPQLLFAEHHQSHAASAFFVSPYQEAAVLCLDGVGEWATTTCWYGKGNQLNLHWEIDFPHSLGLLYSAFTYYTGFKVNSGEYKLMGLAPYGRPSYVEIIYKHLIDIKEDGSFRLNMKYFDYATGLTMTNKRFHQLFGGPPREPESPVTQKEMDLARSIQLVTEEILLKLARTVHRETKTENLCLAGGVALNCVANGRLLREGPFKNIWIQPAAGDAGGALGAAYATWFQYLNNPRINSLEFSMDEQKGAYLGPQFSSSEIEQFLQKIGAKYQQMNQETLDTKLAEILAQGSVVGLFQGRMEFGPRALGARSIIGDARNQKMQSVMNLKIKYRESFRPFAPAILAEDIAEYFDYAGASPYMLMVANVKSDLHLPLSQEEKNYFGIQKLNVPRSKIPAVTHVDYSARLQTVHEKTNPRFYKILQAFKKQTGCSVLVNTSFNVRGEPIVCTPEDAYRCFMRTEMDYLVLENFLLCKDLQIDGRKGVQDDSWKSEFALD